MTKKDLYKMAQEMDIPGRSKMNKAELEAAIAEHNKQDEPEQDKGDDTQAETALVEFRALYPKANYTDNSQTIVSDGEGGYWEHVDGNWVDRPDLIIEAEQAKHQDELEPIKALLVDTLVTARVQRRIPERAVTPTTPAPHDPVPDVLAFMERREAMAKAELEELEAALDQQNSAHYAIPPKDRGKCNAASSKCMCLGCRSYWKAVEMLRARSNVKRIRSYIGRRQVVTLATFEAVLDGCGSDGLAKYSRPGRKLPEPECGEYSSAGHKVEPCYAIDGDPTPVVFDELVKSGEMLDAGYTFSMAETRFRESSEGSLRRLARSSKTPPEWHGEATTVGYKGRNKMAKLIDMLTDAMVGFAYGAYRVEDKRITLDNLQKAMCDKELVVPKRLSRQGRWCIDHSPNARLKAAYVKAVQLTAEQLKAGEITDQIVGDLDPDTLVLEREAVIEDLAFKMDLMDRNELDHKDFLDWMGIWDKTDFEAAREVLKVYRDALQDKQRQNFTVELDWIFQSSKQAVARRYRFPNGSFHKAKDAKDEDKDSVYSSDARVILDAAAAMRVGRKVSEKQGAMYYKAMSTSTWETWMAFGIQDPVFDDTDPDAPSDPDGGCDNPFAPSGGGLPAREAPAPEARRTVLRRPLAERSPLDQALHTLDCESSTYRALVLFEDRGEQDMVDFLLEQMEPTQTLVDDTDEVEEFIGEGFTQRPEDMASEPYDRDNWDELDLESIGQQPEWLSMGPPVDAE